MRCATYDRLRAVDATLQEQWLFGAAGDFGRLHSPSLANNNEYRKWQARVERNSASPGAALAILKMNTEIHVRHMLPTVSVPTLVLHLTGDRIIRVEHGHYLRQHLNSARYIELPGDDHTPWIGDVTLFVMRSKSC